MGLGEAIRSGPAGNSTSQLTPGAFPLHFSPVAKKIINLEGNDGLISEEPASLNPRTRHGERHATRTVSGPCYIEGGDANMVTQHTIADLAVDGRIVPLTDPCDESSKFHVVFSSAQTL